MEGTTQWERSPHERTTDAAAVSWSYFCWRGQAFQMHINFRGIYRTSPGATGTVVDAFTNSSYSRAAWRKSEKNPRTRGTQMDGVRCDIYSVCAESSICTVSKQWSAAARQQFASETKLLQHNRRKPLRQKRLQKVHSHCVLLQELRQSSEWYLQLWGCKL